MWIVKIYCYDKDVLRTVCNFQDDEIDKMAEFIELHATYSDSWDSYEIEHVKD
jgi:hypothetical protein